MTFLLMVRIWASSPAWL